MRQGGTGAEARAEAWAQRIRGTEPRHFEAESPEAANARVWTRRSRGLDRVLGHYGRRERECPGRRTHLHGRAAPDARLDGAKVLELHDRSVVALPEDRMKRLASFVTW